MHRFLIREGRLRERERERKKEEEQNPVGHPQMITKQDTTLTQRHGAHSQSAKMVLIGINRTKLVKRNLDLTSRMQTMFKSNRVILIILLTNLLIIKVIQYLMQKDIINLCLPQ